MNDVLMNESLVFDACALVEEIIQMSSIEEIHKKAQSAGQLLNRALEEGEKQ